jgi:DNA-binding MarR family transcriptional regulator
MSLDIKTLQRLSSHIFRLDPDMTISRLLVFVLISRKAEGCLVRELTQATGLNQSTIARILALLSDKPQRGERTGLEWVRMDPDPSDPRRVIIYVTEKGKRVLAEIEALAD